jgi:hypothetical protein
MATVCARKGMGAVIALGVLSPERRIVGQVPFPGPPTASATRRATRTRGFTACSGFGAQFSGRAWDESYKVAFRRHFGAFHPPVRLELLLRSPLCMAQSQREEEANGAPQRGEKLTATFAEKRSHVEHPAA